MITEVQMGIDLFSNAIISPLPSVQIYTFRGNTEELLEQQIILEMTGINVVMTTEYLVVNKEDEYKRALSVIWNEQVGGWRRYKDQFVKYGICTKNQFSRRYYGCLPLTEFLITNLEIIKDMEEWWKLVENGDISIRGIPICCERVLDGNSLTGEFTYRAKFNGEVIYRLNYLSVGIGTVVKVRDKEIKVED